MYHTQSKFRHFELVDTKKYNEVWAMKEAEVAALVKQLLQADKVIHEQQLGWDWRPPDDAVFTPVHGTTEAASSAAEKSNAAAVVVMEKDADGNDVEVAVVEGEPAQESGSSEVCRHWGAEGADHWCT